MIAIALYDTTVVVKTTSTTYRIKCDSVREGFAVMYQIAGISR